MQKPVHTQQTPPFSNGGVVFVYAGCIHYMDDMGGIMPYPDRNAESALRGIAE